MCLGRTWGKIPGLRVLKTAAMGSDGPPDISELFDSLFSSLGIATVLKYWQSVRVAAQQTSVANYLRALYRNDTVNWGQVVFLTTCVVTMVGCGLLSRLIRRRRSSNSSSKRRSLRKASTKSAKILTSSDDDYEDEEYDSNGSLNNGTNPHIATTERSSQPQEQTSDGKTNSDSFVT